MYKLEEDPNRYSLDNKFILILEYRIILLPRLNITANLSLYTNKTNSLIY